jgi:formyl-CoA transferase
MRSMELELGGLQGLRVIEMGVLLAGPFCGQLMADHGAEVIKVEQPAVGDPMRDWGRGKPHGQSLWWSVVSRGKKSVTLNLREAEGQQLARSLLEGADVLIENFRPGTLERWSLGPEVLHALNPELVIVRVTGFGQSGPYAAQPGYGAIGEAMGGLRYVVGEPGRPPSRVGISLGDALAAVYGCMGALIALRARARTGRGQVVDAAIYEAVLAMMESLIPEYAIGGYVRERSGAILPNVAPSNIYPTKDGMLLIAANQDTVFRRLCHAMGRPTLATDGRFATHSARGDHQLELDAVIAEWSSARTTTELRELLVEHAVPHGPVYTAKEMLEDEHFAARDAIVDVPHPVFGSVPMQNVVPKLSDTPGRVRSTGPRLGEHNLEIWQGLLGLDERRLQELQSAGII